MLLRRMAQLFAASTSRKSAAWHSKSSKAHSHKVTATAVSASRSLEQQWTATSRMTAASATGATAAAGATLSSSPLSTSQANDTVHGCQESLLQLKHNSRQQHLAEAASQTAAVLPPPQPPQANLLQHRETLMLHIDPDSLPPAASPDADTRNSILCGAATPPDLSRSSCPHLYYNVGSIVGASQPQHQQQQQQQDALQAAAQLLRAGEPVAMPTETVYGLAANALSTTAVAAVFAAKGRPSDNPLIVHISDIDMLAQLYPEQQPQDHSANKSSSSSDHSLDFIPQQYRRLIAAFWPGPLTLLLPASPLIPAAVTAGLPTVAVRMPAHPVARALIAAAGVPLAAPSANTSGRPSPTTAQHVMQDLAGRVAAVVDGGACECGVESTVLDGLRSPPVVLRPGGVTPEQLEACPDMAGLQVYQRDFRDAALEAQPTTPGMKYRHYSPNTPLLLLDPTAAWKQQQQQQQQSVHADLQQLLMNATQQLLRDLWHQQQQQQQDAAGGATRQRVVLLSTCSSSRNVGVGWTPESTLLLQESQHQHDGNGTVGGSSGSGNGGCSGSNGAHCDSSSSSSSSGFEVLEYVLGSWQQPEGVAQQVFAALRAADGVHPLYIIAQGLPPEGAALAVMNRLHKAASQHVRVDTPQDGGVVSG